LRNPATIQLNRRINCFGLVKPAGTACNEFPFASTYQGAAYVGRDLTSRRAVPTGQNEAAGRSLAAFYANKRVLDGEQFWVDVSPGAQPEPPNAAP